MLELARDCLNKGAERGLTKSYLYEMLDNLEKLLQDARGRSLEAYRNLYPLVKQLLLIVSRPLRLLECLVSGHMETQHINIDIYNFTLYLEMKSDKATKGTRSTFY